MNFDETEEGLLGLTRSTDHEYDMIIDKLHKSGKISSKIFAVFMDYGSSSIKIGDYDLSNVKEPTVPIQYINLMDKTMFWNVPVKAI